MKINFAKMHGTGNDFVLIDNRKKILAEDNLSNLARKICQRRFSLGADGVLLIEKSNKYDFKMRLFNADGSEGEMCGNGARCIAKYAYLKKISNHNPVFATRAGPVKAEVTKNNIGINLNNINVSDINLNSGEILIKDKKHYYSDLIAGVPHCVIFLEREIPEKILIRVARKLRYNREKFPEGVNVNFVEVKNKNTIKVRTYERGVEEITMACGTGSIASSIVSHILKELNIPLKVINKGGRLNVEFKNKNNNFMNIWLWGEVVMVAEGEFYYY